MRTKLWMLGMAVAALTSCTQSEVMDIAQGTNIEFESFLGKSSRADYSNVASVMLKGAGPAENDLKQFWVYGSVDADINSNDNPALFSNTVVYWDVNNSAFTYAQHKQWYEGVYNFAAYSNGNYKLESGVTADLADRKMSFTDYINNGNNDLVAAIPATIIKNETNMSQGVSLDFKHMLACIELKFTNATTAFALDFTDVKFSAVSKGNCVYNADSSTPIVWTPSTAPQDIFVYDFKTNDYNLDDSDDTNNNPLVMLAPGQFARLYCFVIPQDNEEIELTFNIKSYERKNPTGTGENIIYEYHYTGVKSYKASLKVAENGTDYLWKPGRLYRYSADAVGSVHYINFSVSSIDNWNATGNDVESSLNPGEI